MFHGELEKAQAEAEQAYRHFSGLSPDWSWKFRLLEAEILDSRGYSSEVLSLLSTELPPSLSHTDVAVQKYALLGPAYARLGKFADAQKSLATAQQLCNSASCSVSGDVKRARGIVELKQGRLHEAEASFRESLQEARANGDKFLEATNLLNLAVVIMQQDHYGQSVDWSLAARAAFQNLGSGVFEEKILGNLAWAYYKMGNFDQSLSLYREAESKATQLRIVTDQVRWSNNLGLIYFENEQYFEAEDRYRNSLTLARGVNDYEQTFNALVLLALASLREAKLDQAKQYLKEAVDLTSVQPNLSADLYPLFIAGQIAAQEQNSAQARSAFTQVIRRASGDKSLRWQAQSELAKLYVRENQPEDADQQYRAAIATVESARCSLHNEEFRLPFLTNATRVYGDYIHFLVEHERSEEALQLAEYSRARTLAEGLGLLRETEDCANRSRRSIDVREAARKAGGTVLFYWLGRDESYLWVITSTQTSLVKLPPSSEIEASLQRYRQALIESGDVLQRANPAGIELFQKLVASAQSFIPHASRVTVIADRSLNNLNFETLLVPTPKPHYWIEDVTLANASSLRMLAASRSTTSRPRGKLLLIGDPVVPDPKYPRLPNAGQEMQSVSENFPGQMTQRFTGQNATPLAYLTSSPQQYSYIHFVAHGTASELSPLDSAVVLSKATAEQDSFKLYARDVISHPLRADLVTISACYGSGIKPYTGEGLVGLSWAFLRAGAHHVVGALWAVSDDSTPRLMEQFYRGLSKGRSPEDALRDAKLSLLHSDTIFRKPFYWAPFQLYSGS